MHGLSLVVAGRGYLLVVVCRFLIAVASLVAEYVLWACGLSFAAHGLSYSAVCGIFPDRRSNWHPLHWQVGS